MYTRIKRRVYHILEAAKDNDAFSRHVDIFIIALISLNVIAIILGTVPETFAKYGELFDWLEILSVAIFTIEYILRIWSCTVRERFRHPLWGRIRFLFTPMALIDLLAIAPYYLPLFFAFDSRVMRALRLFRLFRLLKIGRYSQTLQLLGKVMRRKYEEMMISAFTIIVMLVIISTVLYYVEHDAQPELFSSIPASMWWGVATMTTVGYGDIYPITALGKFVAAIMAVLGVGIFALPAGILASAFVEQMQEKRKKKEVCPHCGKALNEDIHPHSGP